MSGEQLNLTNSLGAVYILDATAMAMLERVLQIYEYSNTGFQFGYDIAETTNKLGANVYGATVQHNIDEGDICAFKVPRTFSAKGFGIGGTATPNMEEGT